MNRVRLLLIVVIWPICAMPVEAQLFRRKPAPPPPPAAQRVPELIVTLKTDPDERRRNAAAEELREFDPQSYTEIVRALVEAARNDPKAGVRMEAVSSLGKLRPITREAGQALEHAAAEDSNLRARVHARTTLWKYQLGGYSSGSASSVGKRTTEEPPLLMPPTEVAPGPTVQVTPIAPKGALAPRALPTGPTFSTAVPQRPTLVPRPASETTVVEEDLPPLPSAAPPAIAPPPAFVPPPPTASPPPVSAPPPLEVSPPPLTGPALAPFPSTPPVSTSPIPLPEAPPVIVPVP